jgi:four helix bundle protein
LAKGSCAEVRSQLYVARDADYLEKENFILLMQMAREVGRIVGGLRKSIENKRDKK